MKKLGVLVFLSLFVVSSLYLINNFNNDVNSTLLDENDDSTYLIEDDKIMEDIPPINTPKTSASGVYEYNKEMIGYEWEFIEENFTMWGNTKGHYNITNQFTNKDNGHYNQSLNFGFEFFVQFSSGGSNMRATVLITIFAGSKAAKRRCL